VDTSFTSTRGAPGEEFYVRPPLWRRIADLLGKHILGPRRVKEALDSVDVVVATLPPVEALPLVSASLKAGDGPLLVADVQDLADDYRVLERPWLAPAIKLYFRGVYKAMRMADLVLATTEFMAETLKKRLGHERIILAPNGVDASSYKECFDYRRSRARSDLAVFLGDLNFRYHRLDVFIKSLAILRDSYGYKLNLRVVGGGRLIGELERLAENLGLESQVEFLGYRPREELAKLLGEASIAVVGRPAISNRWILDTMRLTTLEYLACGLPIIAYGPPGSYTEYFITRRRGATCSSPTT